MKLFSYLLIQFYSCLVLSSLITHNSIKVSARGNLVHVPASDIIMLSDYDYSKIIAQRRLASSLPLGTKFQSKGEQNYLKLHKCKDAGEVYGASFLVTRQHLISQFTNFNLSYVNCEMGSFIMMNQRFNVNKENENGTLIQSLDVYDFSVVHLSAYERLNRRYFHRLKRKEFNDDNLDPIKSTVEIIRERALYLHSSRRFHQPEQNRTVAIMPFLGSDMGAGHSKLLNRILYLKACFWSTYAEFPNVVAVVKNRADQILARYVNE